MKHSISTQTDTLGKPTKLVVQECKQGTIPLYKQQVLNITKTKLRLKIFYDLWPRPSTLILDLLSKFILYADCSLKYCPGAIIYTCLCLYLFITGTWTIYNVRDV